MRVHSAETLLTMTPAKALAFLKEGNQRFVNNLKIDRDHLMQVNATKDGQFPFAVILSCMDSRTCAELIFDQGLGDIFSIRIAGNILTDEIIGSMEYACKHVGSKLILVVGHSNCGATQGACQGISDGYMEYILEKYRISIEETEQALPHTLHTDKAFMEEVTKRNILHTMNEILERSIILGNLFDSGAIGIAAAYYQVDSGEVTFLKELL